MERLCRLDDLVAATTRGVDTVFNGEPIRLILVHRDGAVHAYHNRCPHVGTPLDWAPGQFLDTDGRYLQCSTHGALFVPETGYCVFGPCRAQSLEALALRVVDGEVLLADDVLGQAHDVAQG